MSFDNLKPSIAKAGVDATLIGSDDTTVTLVPTDKTFGIARFEKKFNDLALLKDLCVGIGDVNIPKIISLDKTKAVVEKAEGVNLTVDKTMSQGDNTDFLAISTNTKMKMVRNYMMVVATVNHDNRVIKDHKPDSIFISKDGVITIVDAGSMEKVIEGKPFQNEVSDRKSTHSLVETLTAFFTRSNPDFTPLIPAGFYSLISQTESVLGLAIESDYLIRDMATYMDDRTPIAPQPSVFIGGQEQKIYKIGMSRVDYDVAVAESWRHWGLARPEK